MDRDIEKYVAVAKDRHAIDYPDAPFSPPKMYPELKKILNSSEINPNNKVYPLVRETFRLLGLDKENYYSQNWSPLKAMVNPGDKVVIKPNMVYHYHPIEDLGFKSMVTHASVIRPVIDYLLLETEGEVQIRICDAPLQSADFDLIIKNSGLGDLVSYYKKKGIDIDIVDLRYEISTCDDEGLIIQRKRGKGDPKGYVTVNLGRRSAFTPIIHASNKLEITDYPSGTVALHHNTEKNEYLIAKSILDNDLFINIPKLKTHKKAGITVAMKNLIGINGDKSWIAHHRRGGINTGGDEYEKFSLSEYLKWHINAILKQSPEGIKINKVLRKIYRHLFWQGKSIKEAAMNPCGKSAALEGSWWGNDTVWRSILDLNNILLFADLEGELNDLPQRKYMVIVDGIIAGERNGPMEQLPKKIGTIIGGFNPAYVDYLAAAVMGLNYQKIPSITNGLKNEFFPLSPFSLQCDQESPAGFVDKLIINSNVDIESDCEKFLPPDSWEKVFSRLSGGY